MLQDKFQHQKHTVIPWEVFCLGRQYRRKALAWLFHWEYKVSVDDFTPELALLPSTLPIMNNLGLLLSHLPQ